VRTTVQRLFPTVAVIFALPLPPVTPRARFLTGRHGALGLIDDGRHGTAQARHRAEGRGPCTRAWGYVLGTVRPTLGSMALGLDVVSSAEARYPHTLSSGGAPDGSGLEGWSGV
jgi:hypothetical protein